MNVRFALLAGILVVQLVVGPSFAFYFGQDAEGEKIAQIFGVIFFATMLLLTLIFSKKRESRVMVRIIVSNCIVSVVGTILILLAMLS